MALSPPPSSVPLLDESGNLNLVWEQWFQSIYTNNNLETLIKTVDLNSDSSVIFDINSLYKAYKIDLDKVALSAEGLELKMFGSSDGGITYDETNLLNQVNNIVTTNVPINGFINLRNATESGFSTIIGWDLEYGISGDFVINRSEKEYTETTTINNVKLELSSGTLSAGRIRLIGLKQ